MTYIITCFASGFSRFSVISGITECFLRVQVQAFFVEFGVTIDTYNRMRTTAELTEDELKANVIARKTAKNATVAVE